MFTLYLYMPTRTITICTGATLKSFQIMTNHARENRHPACYYVIRDSNECAIWRL